MFKLLRKLVDGGQSYSGLAIGETKIRALELSGNLSNAKVESFSQCWTPKGIFSPEGIVDSGSLAKALVPVFEKPMFGRFSDSNVVVNLPESRCFVRVIHVASMSDSEIEASVPFEAESYIPIPIDQVYLDWQKIGEDNGRVALLLVASPKVFVDQLLSSLDGAGLRPLALEVESLAIARAMIPLGSKKNVLIADMRTTRTDLVMVEKGFVQFTSTIPISGSSITGAIAKGLAVDQKRAEEIKADAGFGSTEEYPNLKTLVTPVLESFVAEIKKVIDFHDQHSPEKVGEVLLAGGAARLKHLDEYLQSKLGSVSSAVEIGLGDPTINIKASMPEKLQGVGSLTYAVALGLAMREMKP